MEEFFPEEQGFRYVPCYCRKTQVVSRRDPSKDQYAVCSRECFNKMVNDGKTEPGSLYLEVLK